MLYVTGYVPSRLPDSVSALRYPGLGGLCPRSGLRTNATL